MIIAISVQVGVPGAPGGNGGKGNTGKHGLAGSPGNDGPVAMWINGRQTLTVRSVHSPVKGESSSYSRGCLHRCLSAGQPGEDGDPGNPGTDGNDGKPGFKVNSILMGVGIPTA